MSTKKEGPVGSRALNLTAPSSCSKLPGPSAAVNADSETIALLQEAVWLLTGIYNMQVEQLTALQAIEGRIS
jgi:hypothetical protein